ncbi:DNA repair protein RecN [Curvibacter sp. HBC61]|uniref:DNA repair protein RecN n=1 Tax=Curvibacter cyanobacteriorum TaxID=3026422 RepID=A0ABT5MZ35_9BURK|nr:DNA repair protein RecN [Curvibacter sp. HBC61]MDD0839294.1 DNA repair protein RecN [Curvibacter sp. HBC61]
MALKRITLRDFVIVEALELDLSQGFTVLTGETGAGKSILIDAVQLTLGARAEASVVRDGAQRADLCAEFEHTPNVLAWLQEAGLDGEDTLLLRRTVDNQGKSRAWINGTPATATQLRQLGDLLLDIHGQHAWQSLTRPESVRGLLDAYAQIDTRPLDSAWQQWRQAQSALDTARAAQATLLRERERLTWQIGELDKLAPAPDEWEELSGQHTRLSHMHTLLEGAQAALDILEGEESGALALLSRTQSRLQEHEHLEPEFQAIADVLASSLAQAEDAAHSLHAWLRRTDLDPDKLAQLDQRLTQWMGLARRYKRPPTDLAQLLADWKTELRALDAAADLDQLERQASHAEQHYLATARQVSRSRAVAAPQLSRAITQAMQSLGMKGGRFEVALPAAAQPTASGLEDVVFLVAGHAGTSTKPVGKVASGGELSRIALAIAVTTSQLGQAQTLIFDEVDSGVGGAVAQTVGRLMRQLGQDRQVLAVTHLAQVAASAHQHLRVAKVTDAQGHTRSGVAPVSGESRVQEIARMLGGETQSEASLAHAREMLGTEPPAPRKKRA